MFQQLDEFKKRSHFTLLHPAIMPLDVSQLS